VAVDLVAAGGVCSRSVVFALDFRGFCAVVVDLLAVEAFGDVCGASALFVGGFWGFWVVAMDLVAVGQGGC